MPSFFFTCMERHSTIRSSKLCQPEGDDKVDLAVPRIVPSNFVSESCWQEFGVVHEK